MNETDAEADNAGASSPTSEAGQSAASQIADADDCRAPAVGQPATSEPRCGFVAIIGPPNAGKSTLVNALVGTKVTIVSRKVQTTRTTIRGIAMAENSQLVLIDTPGIFAPKRRLDRAMVDAAWSGASDADVVVLMIDAKKGRDEEADAILHRLGASGRRRLLVLNKVDRLDDKAELLALAQDFSQAAKFDEIYMLSATNGDGLDALREDLARHVPPGPWLYPADDVSDLPMRLLAAEVLREKIYDRLHQELPYAITVETTAWTDMGSRGVRIDQTIYVERESQRAIVLGKKGQTIKSMATDARLEIADIVERPVHLFTFVKVRENWSDDPERYREMGLSFPLD